MLRCQEHRPRSRFLHNWGWSRHRVPTDPGLGRPETLWTGGWCHVSLLLSTTIPCILSFSYYLILSKVIFTMYRILYLINYFSDGRRLCGLEADTTSPKVGSTVALSMTATCISSLPHLSLFDVSWAHNIVILWCISRTAGDWVEADAMSP